MSVSALDVAKLAMLLEGEGSFCATKNSGQPRPWVEMSSTDEDVIRWIQAAFGGWAGKRSRRGKCWKPHYKDQYQWVMQGARAAGIMYTVYPFMFQRRRSQIRAVIERWLKRPINAGNIALVWLG